VRVGCYMLGGAPDAVTRVGNGGRLWMVRVCKVPVLGFVRLLHFSCIDLF